MLKYPKKAHPMFEEKNPMWKGDSVGKHQLHTWVKARLPRPVVCDNCHSVPPYDLANKGIYNRELKNWKWLCRKCHMHEDGRIKDFLKHRRSMPKGNKMYLLVKNRPKGETHPTSKLKDNDIRKIREMYSTGEYTQQQIADIFKICFQSVSLIVLGKTWKHLI